MTLSELVEILKGSVMMQIDQIGSPWAQSASSSLTQRDRLIKVEEIKSILYLGVTGDLSPQAPKEHSVDTFA